LFLLSDIPHHLEKHPHQLDEPYLEPIHQDSRTPTRLILRIRMTPSLSLSVAKTLSSREFEGSKMCGEDKKLQVKASRVNKKFKSDEIGFFLSY
jgi:hypothetical protein